MTVTIEQLRERLVVQFPDVQQIENSIIRFTRRKDDLPFAVYYLDVTEDLPTTQEKLTEYQDRVIGRHYFDGKKSLQWSNYLYFVTSGERLARSEVRHAKELIEHDRSYARKLVVAEEDLDSVLAPPVIEPATARPRVNILSQWTDLLAEAGLEAAILSNDDLPKRLALIESSSSQAGAIPKLTERNVQVSAAQSIHSLELKTFRPFPLRRKFEFGTVNLIFGANGAGKTSLLEAIELCYCGKNKRNPTPPEPYELIAVLADGKIEQANAHRDLQLFRDRNLSWYGQSEVKSTHLYLSFAQFNVLDTDAAVHLADSNLSDIDDDLSKLLVGPDASKTWRDVERVYGAVGQRLKDVRPLETLMTEELTTIDFQLKAPSGMKQESDSIRTRLDEMTRRLGWAGNQGEKQAVAGKIVEVLTELVSIAQQAAALDWTEPPTSIDGLTTYCREAKVTAEKVEPDITRLEELTKSQKRLSETIERAHKASDAAEQARRLVDAGVPNRTAQHSKAQSGVATYSGLMTALDADALRALSPVDFDMEVVACHKAATSKRAAAEKLLRTARAKYADFSKLRDQSLKLAQELREVATRILKSSPKPYECPLCHTQFAPGELTKHINVGIDEQIEARGQVLLKQIREQEAMVYDATSRETAAASLIAFCERAGVQTTITVRLALGNIEDARRALADSTIQAETLSKDLLTLQSQGLSMETLERVSTQLRELGYPLADFSPKAAEQLLRSITQVLIGSSQKLEVERKLATALQQTLETTLGCEGSGISGIQGALSRLNKRLVATDILIVKLARFSTSFPWSGTRPLAELVVEADSVRKVAAELQSALGREKQAQASQAEAIKRRETLNGDLGKLRPRIRRLDQAHTVLTSLRERYSLEKAMDSALQQNRVAIESIFSHLGIHLTQVPTTGCGFRFRRPEQS